VAERLGTAIVAIAVFLAAPAWAVDGANVPHLSGMWGRTTTFGYEFPLSGPGPLRNLGRRHDGTSNPYTLVGDWHNPILKPETAAVVKRNGEISLSGHAFPDPANQCRPMVAPYILRSLEVELLQEKDKITILYMQDSQFRTIRLNAQHPRNLVPSWHGDSVGHFEGDTLIVDTIGVKVGPDAAVDMFGTPYGPALHVVERYRLIPGAQAKAAQDRAEAEYGHPTTAPVYVAYAYMGPGLQVRFTVDDPEYFTTPWAGQVTYRHATNEWQELPCAESPAEYYAGTQTPIPEAGRPDF
jgi:hypothetical protein